MTEQQVSHPLDVFVTNDQDRQILGIYIKHLAGVSPRKRRVATERAVESLRAQKAPEFKDALARSLRLIEKNEEQN
jgi:hypothetical protein